MLIRDFEILIATTKTNSLYPLPGETAVSIMTGIDALDSLEMRCRGGDGCCVKNNLKMCGEGDGDCNNDYDCDVGLVCRKDNCGQSVRNQFYKKKL